MSLVRSAGVLMWRRREGRVEVLLVHPGGPFHARRDDGAWSIPKGEIDAGEDALAAARRELAEETGFAVDGDFVALEPSQQRAGKRVYAWAVETDADPQALVSNTFELEWPPRSGKVHAYPEVDRAEWFDLQHARRKILSGQLPLLDQLSTLVPRSAR